MHLHWLAFFLLLSSLPLTLAEDVHEGNKNGDDDDDNDDDDNDDDAGGVPRLPDFMIIGAMKGGTTCAMNNLNYHPDIYIPQKEMHAFDHGFPDPKVYAEHFASNSLLVGEKTPRYMYSEEVAGRVHTMLPNVKLIAFLRNPIDRAYSHWQTTHRRHTETVTTFEEDIKANLHRWRRRWGSYIGRGLYAEQLDRWTVFPQEHLHIEITEEVEATLDYNRTFKFLGVEPYYIEVMKNRRHHYLPMKNETRKLMAEFFREHNNRLHSWLLQHGQNRTAESIEKYWALDL